MHKKVFYTNGDRFGFLTYLREVEPFIDKSGRKRRQVFCSCQCGHERVFKLENLTIGDTTSCGCHQKSNIKKGIHKTHGKSHTREYKAFKKAKGRCNLSYGYKATRYRFRGIKFMFDSFDDFFNEIGAMPEGMWTLERINNDGNYEKGNVRWATQADQNRNTSKTRRYQVDGVPMNIHDLSIHTGIPESTIKSRIDKKWNIHDVINVPVGVCRKKHHGPTLASSASSLAIS